ncbi:HlyD family efflux transporter periplasmic adaptor subunit [Cellulomonas wangsupingiae]|uniref:HlyD family secretion protein n=1 Tax=Cellulomonas wangsupingiae TaxID=2968085 RepID=A0ABY5K5R8_9CELL|nr:HlyD family efflux transporter periplasmic adaptor subunit [Cellulomonas wangsupingiae]MCC2336026.1 HlyD family secretion protein [Cellulomonas wangsupingiae]MCM0639663.1 HlyD family secretion protein [Cellulomonas wangsupingiae]UUI64751.1 HlyD family secretion protein [Cellulomonas wangsupingiae]
MTWASRVRLLAGTVLVLVVAALATYHLNETRGLATSSSAQILARTYDVGTPYPGLVADQLVDLGDDVVEGDPLFVIDSAGLTYELANGLTTEPPEFTRLDEQNRLVVLASGDGRVTRITGTRGTFVPSASALATVQRAGTLYVQAEYTLTAKEYARLPDGADVTITLPNETTLPGKVDRVEVTTVAGQAQAVVRITSDRLVDGTDNGLVAAGTPVVAQIALTNDGVVTTLAAKVRAYVEGVLR